MNNGTFEKKSYAFDRMQRIYSNWQFSILVKSQTSIEKKKNHATEVESVWMVGGVFGAIIRKIARLSSNFGLFVSFALCVVFAVFNVRFTVMGL